MFTHVSEAARRLESHVAVRRSSFPGAIRIERAPAIAAVVAQAGAGLPDSTLAILADLALAIFAFDDIVDETDIDRRDAELRAAQLVATAIGEDVPEVAWDPAARLLAHVGRHLRRSPVRQRLWPLWHDAIANLFFGMVEGARPSGQTVTLDDYLEIAGPSIGVGATAVAAALLIGDDVNPLLLQRELRRADRVVRAANDLRSYERERGRSRNALAIPGVTEAALVEVIGTGRARLWAVEERLGAGVGRFVARLVDASVAMYAERDFHTLEPA